MDGNRMSRKEMAAQIDKVRRGHLAVYMFVALCVLITGVTFGFDEKLGLTIIVALLGILIMAFFITMGMAVRATRIVRRIASSR